MQLLDYQYLKFIGTLLVSIIMSANKRHQKKFNIRNVMKTLRYIFATLLTVTTFASTFAATPANRITEEPKTQKTQAVLRTEILSLIDSDAATEVDRNLTFGVATVEVDYLTNLIEANTAQEQENTLELQNVNSNINTVKMENLFEYNALQEVDSQLFSNKISINFLQEMIEANATSEVNSNLIVK